MNKLCYRVVFNRTRQMLMVVSELARACGGATGDKETASPAPSSACLKLSSLSWAILLAAGLVTQTASAATAGIVVDKSAASNQQATVISNRNGPTQVNIQTPNSNGLSHNKYTQFDVNSQGVVLNNSSSSTRSELAGGIAANPSLARGEAKVILNEVNSRNPSQLRGYVEVAGKKADVIIANPAGITCDGCGFINAGRATLAAGQAQVNNGALSGFDVDNGRIQIKGYMDGSDADYTTLIARSVAVNARLQAKDLNITTGRNQTDAQGNVISTSADSATNKPSFALDVASVGGMYAGKITMTGTERGVGVRNAGEIGASVGELALSADGQLINNGKLSAAKAITLKGSDIDSRRGKIVSSGSASVNATGQFRNDYGYFYAAGDTDITAAQISNRNGEIIAKNNLAMTGATDNTGGEIDATGKLRLDTRDGALKNQNGKMYSKADMSISGAQIDNSQGWLISYEGASVNASGQFRNDDGHFHVTRDSDVTAAQISNRRGNIRAENLVMTGATDNTGGEIETTGELRIDARDGVLNNQKGKMLSKAAMSVAGAQIDNRQGRLTGYKGSSINTSGSFLNDNGYFSVTGDTAITAAQISNRKGEVRAGNLVMTGAMDNSGGEIETTGELRIDARDGVLNNQKGKMLSRTAISLTGAQIDNRQGRLTGYRGSSINTSGSFLNDNGYFSVTGDTAITAAQISNRKGEIRTGNLVMTGAMDNTDGEIEATGELRLDTRDGVLNNQKGKMLSRTAISLTGAQIDNRQGRLTGYRGSSINTSGSFLNDNGYFSVAGDTDITAAQISNRQGEIRAGNLVMSGAMDNTGGEIETSGELRIDTRDGVLNNQKGRMLSRAGMSVTGAQIDNRQGWLTGFHGIRVSTSGSFLNDNGYLSAARDSAITAAQISNRQGEIRLENLAMTGALENTRGLIEADGDVQLDTRTGTLNNQNGQLMSRANMSIIGAQINNHDGQISASNLTLSTTERFKQDGLLFSSHVLTINAAAGLDNSREITARRILSITAPQLNNQGEINGQNTLVRAEQLVNTGGITGYENHIIASSLANTGTGGIYGDNLTIDARTLINNADENGNSARIYGHSSVKIATDNLTNRDGAQIYSDGDMAIGKTLSEDGVVSGLAQKVENLSADIVAMGTLNLSAQSIENRDIHLLLGDKMVEVYYSPGKNEWQYCEGESNGPCAGGDGKRYTFGPWMNGKRYALNEDGSHNYGIYIELENVTGGNRLSFHIPEQGVNSKHIYEYQYQTRVYETEMLNSATATIGSGKEMHITANNLLNEDSQILAVEDLVMQVNNLENREQKRTRRTEEVGNTTSYYIGSDGKTHQELLPYDGEVKVEEVSNSLITGNYKPKNG